MFSENPSLNTTVNIPADGETKEEYSFNSDEDDGSDHVRLLPEGFKPKDNDVILGRGKKVGDTCCGCRHTAKSILASYDH